MNHVKDWTPSLNENGKPRYLQIADAIGAAIKAGDLNPGDRLPPQRKLAERLRIDFTTVSRAYTEAAARSLLESHVGRGTFVRAAAPSSEAPDPQRGRDEDLSMNMPPEPEDRELLERMSEGLRAVSANLTSLLRYQSTTGSDRDKWEADTYGGDKPKVDDFRARFVALCLVDEKGNRLFTDKEVAQLGAKSVAALDRVYRAAQKLNALGEADSEELEKNS